MKSFPSKGDIATLPMSGHLNILRSFIEDEQRMRNWVFKRDTEKRARKIMECQKALQSLEVIEAALKEARNAGA